MRDTESVTVNIEVMGIERVRGAGRLLAFGIVRVEIGGVELTLQGVQIVRAADGSISVRAPMFRHPRDGRSHPSVLLPSELSAAIADEVLALARPLGP